MPFITIRSTLLALIGSLGLLIVALAAAQLSDLLTIQANAQRQYRDNVVRSRVVDAGLALASERDAMFIALATGSEVSPSTVAETDRSFADYKAAILLAEDNGSQEPMVELFEQTLPEMREDARRALSLPLGSQGRDVQAAAWFNGMAGAVSNLRGIRLRLLNEGEVGKNLFNLYYLRTLTLILLDDIMKNGALLEAEIFRQSRALPSEPNTSYALPTAEIAISVRPFEEFLSSISEREINLAAGNFDAQSYSTAETALRQALGTGVGLEAAIENWRSASRDAVQRLEDLQAATFQLAQDRVQATRAEARTYTLVWALVICMSTLILAVAVRVVLAWVIAPLERMRSAMLELANDNLGVKLPTPSRIREIGAMDDALRVFKANATRRQTLQRERLKLHGRLEETYTHLKSDLEAAAVIQASLLPQQAQMAGVSLSSYFRPSHFLAGDTFDVLQQPDGRVIVFQIDVAGHGAAAALVSVASKYTVAQAILQRRPGADLAELVEEINREWPSDLPYFTLLLAEIDPATGRGDLVQAGHPSPILLSANGDLVVLGEGGLPIGALAQATFEAIPFSFSSNDRLVLTTDGVFEMEDRNGNAFSNERLHALLDASRGKATEQIIAELDAAMRSWRGDDTLDDDVTIVVLEVKEGR